MVQERYALGVTLPRLIQFVGCSPSAEARAPTGPGAWRAPYDIPDPAFSHTF